MGLIKKVKSVRGSIAPPKIKAAVERSQDKPVNRLKKLGGKVHQIAAEKSKQIKESKPAVKVSAPKFLKKRKPEPEIEEEQEIEEDYNYNDSEESDFSEGE